MLSYQHIYHAGNPADVQKHALLAWLLDYMARKDKAMTYLESHSGRGLYALDAPEAIKTGEAAAGIARMERLFAPDHPYLRCLARVREAYGPQAYPGSPLIAGLLLRGFDRMHLAELHPRENAALHEAMEGLRAEIRREDGLKMAVSLTPPLDKRGVLMIDPSYEVKDEYERIPEVIGQVHRRWSVGVIMLWYPILESGSHVPMLRALQRAHPDALRHEVRFPPVRPGHRMIGSGMFVINPAWGMEEECARLDAIFARIA